MKTLDCFTFFNELDLLELRLMTLDDVVDKFVIVEANKTHTGKSKEFNFENNKDRYEKYLNKIIYIKVEDLPDYRKSDFWGPENFQRNCITRGLVNNAFIDDKIIISDLDEIPNPQVIETYKYSDQTIVMEQYLFYYYLNCIQHQLWRGSIMTNYKVGISPQQLRHTARGMPHGVPGLNPMIVQNGGWHYSFMGGAENIRYKVENIAESHLIIESVGTIEQIKEKIESQKDLWDRKEDYAQKNLIDIEQPNMSPTCVKEFIKKYPNFYYNQ